MKRVWSVDLINNGGQFILGVGHDIAVVKVVERSVVRPIIEVYLVHNLRQGLDWLDLGIVESVVDSSWFDRVSI